jgi:hypothetical protein
MKGQCYATPKPETSIQQWTSTQPETSPQPEALRANLVDLSSNELPSPLGAIDALESLQELAYHSSILGIHIDWLHRKNTWSGSGSGTNKRRADEMDQEPDVDTCDEESNIDNLKNLAISADQTFHPQGATAAAVLRWLRLL